MKLELSSFEKALASLDEALAEYDRTQNQFVKDACIHRFEYTYELAHKWKVDVIDLNAVSPQFRAIVERQRAGGLIKPGSDN
ncbi:nucleotidyltransferase substrate binding protein [Halomonas sp. CH40]